MADSKRTLGDTVETLPVGARRPDGPARFRLVVLASHGAVVHPLPPAGEVTLGRSRQSAIQVPDPSISRVHATLLVGPDALRVRDEGSANGVFVRDARVAPRAAVALAPGELFTLGSVGMLVQRVPADHPDARAATPAPAAAPAAALLVARDPAMRELVALAERVARSAISVLILGETGVGKELLAAHVHGASPRASAPFVGLNCAALAPALLESELFGHEKGAFTGADRSKPGLLESADGGTVFLDEVGELPLAVQAKLLRVLEERAVPRVGALRPRPIDVRVVSATNRDLKAEVAAGTFRQDLYFRLNGATLTVPPLRERPSEVEPLARLFAARAAAALGSGSPPEFAPEALALLARYDWPGNVRELRNAVERAVVVCTDGVVTPALLPPELRAEARPRARVASPAREAALPLEQRETMRAPAMPAAAAAGGLRADLEALERQRILDALAQCAGNQTRAAELLGMPRRTLTKRLAQYQIPRPRQR